MAKSLYKHVDRHQSRYIFYICNTALFQLQKVGRFAHVTPHCVIVFTKLQFCCFHIFACLPHKCWNGVVKGLKDRGLPSASVFTKLKFFRNSN